MFGLIMVVGAEALDDDFRPSGQGYGSVKAYDVGNLAAQVSEVTTDAPIRLRSLIPHSTFMLFSP